MFNCNLKNNIYYIYLKKHGIFFYTVHFRTKFYGTRMRLGRDKSGNFEDKI